MTEILEPIKASDLAVEPLRCVFCLPRENQGQEILAYPSITAWKIHIYGVHGRDKSQFKFFDQSYTVPSIIEAGQRLFICPIENCGIRKFSEETAKRHMWVNHGSEYLYGKSKLGTASTTSQTLPRPPSNQPSGQTQQQEALPLPATLQPVLPLPTKLQTQPAEPIVRVEKSQPIETQQGIKRQRSTKEEEDEEDVAILLKRATKRKMKEKILAAYNADDDLEQTLEEVEKINKFHLAFLSILEGLGDGK
ncbi:hypothetical protein BJ508DRAFT_301747 [Ascobolus immersus RN42]|uniref:Uncharacterized protein n=1 Tax=Ascobolus immersus RN42 TaxID=1160509 RepID=A0A3N4IRV0_ASCIM|nr:hypothetical protein BJ508DRAFT_301747 [Ascobolus immersus RN42]